MTIQTALRQFLMLAIGGVLPAQWGAVRPSPFAVQGSAIAGYDPVSGEAYLFRGSEAWRFDEAVWNRVPTPGSAAPVFGPSCSWPGHGLMVVAGDTWVWNGAAWLQTVTAHSPTALFGLDWDPVRGVAVGLGVALDTWEFDGFDWSLRSTAWPPGGPTVQEARIAFDPIRQRTMAVAGFDYGGPNGFVTYEWDGSTWSMRGPSAAHYGFALSSVPGRGVVISGGYQFPFYFGSTSLWNGTQWIGVGSGAPFPRPTSLSWFDSARGRLVITSGLGTNSISPASAGAFGVWYWDGSQWSRPVAGDGPPFYAPAAWDSWRGRLLRYGGMQYVGMELNELWSRDSATGVWSMLGTGPGARANHVCAFDSRRGRLVVFGGSHFDSGSGADYLVDPLRTSEWDGATWHAIPSPGPGWSQQSFPVGRMRAAMAYDPARGRCVLFGGNFGYGTPMPQGYQNDTWEWDGATWTRMQPTSVPPAVYSPSMWYDTSLGACVLWANGRYAWNGADWLPVATPVLPGNGAYVRFDAAREVLLGVASQVVYELRSGVWLPVGNHAGWLGDAFDLGRGAFPIADEVYWHDVGDASAATVLPFGAGCAGSAGVPVLHCEEPFRLGTIHAAHLARVPANGTFIGLLGSEAGQWRGLPLPIDLGPFGAPQCQLQTEVAANEILGGEAWPVSVPASAYLLGLRFRLQALVLDAAANALGLTATNGLQVEIGS